MILVVRMSNLRVVEKSRSCLARESFLGNSERAGRRVCQANRGVPTALLGTILIKLAQNENSIVFPEGRFFVQMT